MPIPPPTLVTAIFALGRETLPLPFGRDAEHYRRHLPAILSIDCPMVIYTDEANAPLVHELRSDRPTSVHIVHPGALERADLYAPVKRIRSDPAWLAQADWLPESPQARLPAYNPVVLSKPLWLYQQAQSNPFFSTHFYWIDAGLGHTVPTELLSAESFLRLARLHSRFLLLCYPYDPQREVHGFDAAALARLAGVERTRWVARGGLFGGNASAVAEVVGRYSKRLEATLEQGLMGTEESLLTLQSYADAELFDLQFIGPNGLVWPFFAQLAAGWHGDVEASRRLLAELVETWIVSYNAPLQLQRLLASMEATEPALLRTARRVLINNSTDASLFFDYDELCSQYGLEQIREGNRGINGARHRAAELFQQGGRHAMFWFEDDMLLVAEADPAQSCENGLPRHVYGVGAAALGILQREFADYVKLSFTEVFGAHHTQWAWNVLGDPAREHYFPGAVDAPPQSVSAIQSFAHVPYAVGEAYYSNWPHIITRVGTQKLFFEEFKEPCYEQYWAARSFEMLRQGRLRAAVLLASPVEHRRTQDYARVERVEYQRVESKVLEAPAERSSEAPIPARVREWPLQQGSIFVSIANYRDSETPHTVRDLFSKATRPERVFAGVFSQVVPGTDDDCLPTGAPVGHLREFRVHAGESLGACWARSRILEELLHGEEYVLQIDSHSRFEPGWDERLIEMLRGCPTPRALLTTYPPSYRPPDERALPVATVLAADNFNDMGILLVKARAFDPEDPPAEPVPAAFLSANFLFGPAAAFREVPYDPHLYFHGEEISLAARFWTNGWDLYAPHRSVLYHDYSADRGRPRNWDDRRDWVALNMRSFARLRHIFGVEKSRDPSVLREVERYGLGSARSLAEYEEFADITFATSRIGPRAADARFPGPTQDSSLAMLRDARGRYLESRPRGDTSTPVLETRSGEFSTLAATARLRPALEAWLRNERIRALVDAGCGDFNWMQAVDLSSLSLYAGYDIVPELIAANQKLYGGRRGHFFVTADVCRVPIAPCDAIVCRNVLRHMPESEALLALDNFRSSGARYLLATVNDVTAVGPLLEVGPAPLPTPEAVLPDADGLGLAVWRLSSAF